MHAEHVEGVREHEELRFRVHRGALRRRGQPRRADLDAVEVPAAPGPALGIEVRRGSDDPPVAGSRCRGRVERDRGEREPAARSTLIEHELDVRLELGLTVGHGCPRVGAAVFAGRQRERGHVLE